MKHADLARILRELADQVEARNVTALFFKLRLNDQNLIGGWKAGEDFYGDDEWRDAAGVLHLAHIATSPSMREEDDPA